LDALDIFMYITSKEANLMTKVPNVCCWVEVRNLRLTSFMIMSRRKFLLVEMLNFRNMMIGIGLKQN